MKLRKLQIEMEQWGPNEGRYTGKIEFRDDKNTEVHLELTPDQADKFTAFAAPLLMAAADNAAEQFKTKLLASLPAPVSQLTA